MYRLSSGPERFFSPNGTESSSVSFAGLQSAHSLLQCFALFTDLCELSSPDPLSPLKNQLDCFRTILGKSEGQLHQVKTVSDLITCMNRQKNGVLLSMEESCLSEHPVSLLPKFFDLGVRMATLTWDYSTILASSAVNAPPHPLPNRHLFPAAFSRIPEAYPGLTPAGFDFLSEAERLGILIDVSHLSDAGFRDVATHSKRPFLASHSNARSVCNVPRNLTDDMLRTLARQGGLTGLCLHEPFLSPGPLTKDNVTEALIAHISHIFHVGGSEVLALGTDFDGMPGNCAIPDISRLPLFAEQLKKAGFTSGQIDNLFYKNALRFFKENLPA
ncbi:MAG: membrane dipeptidase [Lachnospiraceae bacterium]|nr:membrane dipeptidase [Lachnospiraceae bacterium]